MKKFIKTFLAATFVAFSITALAYPPIALDAFSGPGIAVGTTLSYTVVSAYSKNAGTPVVNFISAQSEKAASVVQFYSPNTNTSANYVSTTVSLPVAFTNGFASGDIIVIRHASTDTYERRILTTFTSATNLTVTVAPTVALAVGDSVYRMVTDGTIAWGPSTNTISAAAGLYSGLPGKPVLVEIDFTAAGSINTVNANYVTVPTP